jgi:hypothetical protein
MILIDPRHLPKFGIRETIETGCTCNTHTLVVSWRVGSPLAETSTPRLTEFLC